MSNLIPDKYKQWAGLAVCVVVGVLGYLHTWEDMGAQFVLWAGRGAMLLVIVSNVFGLSVPTFKTRAVSVIMIGLAAVLMLSAGCKVPPLATAYRAHGLMVTARDGAGETIANQQRAAAVRCEAAHKGKLVPLRDCLHKVREPVRAWVQHIRPAITATASTYWLALESAYVLQDRSLDKLSQAAQLACSALTALEVTLRQYAAHLGKLRAVLLGAVAGGKVLVCPR